MSTRILVVDDETDTLDLLQTILEISGYSPITTLNSVDAIGLAEAEKPDIVLLDIMMPKLDGFTLCKMMRANPATKDLPIIFVTAYESLDIEERRVEAGADMVINKPIDMDELIAAINKARQKRAAPPPVPAVNPAKPQEIQPAAAAPPAPVVNPAKTQEIQPAAPADDQP